MEEEKNQSLDESVSSEVELASEGGEENDENSSEQETAEGKDDLLEKINETTGRSYKNVEDALKGIKETYSFVGKKQEVSGKKQEVSKEEEEQSKKLEDIVKDNTAELQKLRFLKAHPEAEAVYATVKALAKDSESSLEDAYNNSDLPDLLDAKKSLDETKEKSTIAKSKGRTGVSDKELSDLSQKADGSNDVRAAEELVGKALGM